ncbi:MAG: radical SAM protein [Chlorobi bacterium]|nr:radical SAM protein [Chlorobiota bacterium]
MLPRFHHLTGLWTSYHLSRLLKRNFIWGLPVAMSIEPTTYCNLRCPQCPSGLRSFTRPTGSISLETYINFLEKIKSHVAFLTLYFQGEPFLNPHFIQMVKEARDRNMYVMTSTNGHFLSEATAREVVLSGLNRIIFSIDGITQETYEKYRVGGDLSKALQNLKLLSTVRESLGRKNPIIVFQFIVFKHNEHELGKAREIAYQHGADIFVIKSAQIYDENKEPYLPENTRYSRYVKQPDGTFQLKGKLLNKCWRLWHNPVVTWDGRWLPCCFDKDGKYVMGNLLEQEPEEIWNSPKYKQFREVVLTDRRQIDICRNCSEGLRVTFFD